MAKALLIDVGRCSGCMNCQLACKDEHAGNDWRPYAAAQPMTGQFWCKVNENVCGTIPKVKLHYIPMLCGHCGHPACMEAGDNGAVYRREDGLVIIDPEKAKGQKAIADSCPLGVIYFNEKEGLPQKCTGCAHLLDNGVDKPRCVEACPTDAMKIMEESEIPKNAVRAGPEELGARLYHLNIPGKFIAATVYDPVEKEVIIGARCRLRSSDNTKSWETETDSYGDFWFKDLPIGEFELMIEAEGFDTIGLCKLSTEKDVNLGDIPMQRDGSVS